MQKSYYKVWSVEGLTRKKVRDMYNDIAEDVNKLKKLKPIESRKKNAAYF